MLVVSSRGAVQWSEVFANNPKIATIRDSNVQRLVNASGARPYILSKGTQYWIWRACRLEPGELFFTPDELAFAEPYRGRIMVEPSGKDIGHTNKLWPWDRWQQVVRPSGLLPFVQCGAPGSRWLDDVQRVETPTFRHACAVLSVSKAFVGNEGGLHHAAAALGVPAVVLFGGFISPSVTGYPGHRNLFTGTGLGCGMRTNCAHCREAMDRISVAEVLRNLREVL